MVRNVRLSLVSLGLVLAALATCAQGREEVVTVPSRAGMTVPYLLTVNSAAPRWVFVLLSGGYGDHRLSQRGEVIQLYSEQKLLARLRERLAGDNAATALLDVPSDQNRLSDSFRASPAHAQDIAAVLADLQARFPGSRAILMGHSNGTISVAHAAAVLGERLEAVVLVSGRLVEHWFGGAGLSKFDFGQLKPRLLLVHHVNDACAVTPYAGSLALAERFPLISVNGPPNLTAGGCSFEGAHEMSGRDAPVAAAIRAWVSGDAWPKVIE